MKRKIIFIIIFIVVISLIAWASYSYISTSKKRTSETTNAQRLESEININTQTYQNQEESKRLTNEEITKQEAENNSLETDLSSYSSPLKDKSAGRLNNIRITCNTLNGTIVSSGETFSFCNTVGPATSEKGYKKASVIVNKKTIQALGGGNCQVSSTLYNAVLAINDLTIIERHEHEKDVTYVPEGKDAAVSYGSVDFKFKNNMANNIKLYFSTDDVNVSVRIVKLGK